MTKTAKYKKIYQNKTIFLVKIKNTGVFKNMQVNLYLLMIFMAGRYKQIIIFSKSIIYILILLGFFELKECLDSIP